VRLSEAERERRAEVLIVGASGGEALSAKPLGLSSL
jgi:hypothetical protein